MIQPGRRKRRTSVPVTRRESKARSEIPQSQDEDVRAGSLPSAELQLYGLSAMHERSGGRSEPARLPRAGLERPKRSFLYLHGTGPEGRGREE